ncbi:3376_t:CDS:2, partial [Ambispora gerdemannii]
MPYKQLFSAHHRRTLDVCFLKSGKETTSQELVEAKSIHNLKHLTKYNPSRDKKQQKK